MKILVTGSSGQLGQAIMNSSHDLEHEIVFTARTIMPSPSSRHQLLQLDVTDSEAVSEMVREQGIEVIINCTGYTDVARAETEPEKAYLLHEHAAANLALAAKENVIFGGRLGEYKYYDMDKVIEAAMNAFENQ